MRVLAVSPTPSHPQNAGNRVRIYALLKQLQALGHEIHFCFVARESVAEADLEAMRREWDGFTLIPHDRKREKRSMGDHFGIDDWFMPETGAAIEMQARELNPGMVLVNYVFLSKALTYFPSSTFKVIDTHDVFADRHVQLKKLGLEPSFFYTSAAEERTGLNRADVVIAIQHAEREHFERTTSAKVVTVGYKPYQQTAPRERTLADAKLISATSTGAKTGGLRIGYFGSANPINVQSLNALVASLDFGKLQENNAEIVVGGEISGKITAHDGLRVLGAVPHPTDFYDQVDVVINPHFGGTGLKVKTVEALAEGLPVLGTRDAFLGLGSDSRYHDLPDPRALAEAIVEYVETPALRKEVSDASAQTYAEYEQAWSESILPFRDLPSLEALGRQPRGLLVTDVAFWEEALGNHMRIAAVLRGLRDRCRLEVFVLRSLAPKERARVQKIIGPRGVIHVFKDYQIPNETLAVTIHEKGKALTPFEKKAFARLFMVMLERHLAKNNYSFAIIEYIRLSYLRHAAGMPEKVILDSHDVMSLRSRNFANFRVPHYLQIDIFEEISIMSSFTLVLAIQLEEFEFLDKLLPRRIIYLPHTLTPEAPIEHRHGLLKILFVGGNSPMNRDGLRWFMTEIWPCFGRHDAELHVVGEVCDAVADCARGRVVLHGKVAELESHLRSADLAINPVFYGGGLKIKTVEYICHGIPSVCTEEAVRGIVAGERLAYMLATSRAEFISMLDALLTDDPLRARMSWDAFEFGKIRFGTEVEGSALDAIVNLCRA